MKTNIQYIFFNQFQEESIYASTPSITLAELRSKDSTEVSKDLAASLRRERKLKGRIHELVSALEKLSHNSEVSHQQSAQFVNDLKHANRYVLYVWDGDGMKIIKYAVILHK